MKSAERIKLQPQWSASRRVPQDATLRLGGASLQRTDAVSLSVRRQTGGAYEDQVHPGELGGRGCVQRRSPRGRCSTTRTFERTHCAPGGPGARQRHTGSSRSGAHLVPRAVERSQTVARAAQRHGAQHPRGMGSRDTHPPPHLGRRDPSSRNDRFGEDRCKIWQSISGAPHRPTRAGRIAQRLRFGVERPQPRHAHHRFAATSSGHARARRPAELPLQGRPVVHDRFRSAPPH